MSIITISGIECLSGHYRFLLKQKAANSLTLDIGEDRILLETRANVYHLDIFLPYDLIQEECGAQFDRKSKVIQSRE